MRKSILITSVCLSLFCIVFSSEAQIEKGMKVLGGSVSFSNSNSKQKDSLSGQSNKGFGFIVNPQIGVFVSNKVCLGVSGFFGYDKWNYSNYYYSNSNSLKGHSMSYGLSPYVKYFKKFGDNFYGYARGYASFGLQNGYTKSATNTFVPTPSESRTTGYNYSAGVGFGLTYFVTPKLALDVSLANFGYNHSSNSLKDKSYDTYNKSSGFFSRVGLNGIGLGLNYYFK